MQTKRVVAVSNGKGGVGKTSITAALAGVVADSGYRVLAVDMDPQGDLARDFGQDKSTGKALADALISGAPIEPQRDVRPGLDWIAGGEALADVPMMQMARMMRSESIPGLVSVLSSVTTEDGGEYDLVLVDTPPNEEIIQGLVFDASNYVVIPTRSDESSIDGLLAVARRIFKSRETNPLLDILGVVLFGTKSTSTRIRAEVRRDVESVLEQEATVFDSDVRYLETAARDGRRMGMLPYEMESKRDESNRNRIKELRGESLSPDDIVMSSNDTSGLAGDYVGLAREVLSGIAGTEGSRNNESVGV